MPTVSLTSFTGHQVCFGNRGPYLPTPLITGHRSRWIRQVNIAMLMISYSVLRYAFKPMTCLKGKLVHIVIVTFPTLIRLSLY